MDKAPDAFRTISEVADELDVPQHVLRFWETRFTQIKPMKRSGGRRYYRPDDVALLRGIRHMLYGEGYTIRGVQRILREQGVKSLQRLAGVPVSGATDARDVTDEAAEDLNFVEQDDDEIEDDEAGDAEEAAPVAPRAAAMRMPALDIAPAVSSRPAASVAPQPAARAIGKDELAKLKGALDDLDACRKLLDEALQGEEQK